MKHPAIAAALLGAAWLVAGCTAGTAPPPVPPLQVESLPKPPVTLTPLIWQPGHWDWTGNGYAWAPGEYVPRGGHGELWMPAYWERTDSGWVWRPAHWV